MSDLPPEVLHRIIQQLRDDRLLQAIKIYHDETGASLLEAKMEVDALREKLRRGELVEPEGDFDVEPEADYLPPSAMNDIVGALQDRRLIDAVKIYREVMHCSLADAKREVEKIRDQLASGAFTGEGASAEPTEGDQYTPPAIDKSSGCFGVVLLCTLAAASLLILINC